MVGLPSVGKTSIGLKLSPILKMPFIDTDSQIQECENMSIFEFIDQNGEAAFRSLERKVLGVVLNDKKPHLISSGGGVVLDIDNQSLIIKKSFGVHIKCDLNEIRGRLDASNRPLLYNTSKSKALLGLWKERSELYKKVSKIEVDITGMDIDLAVSKIHGKINSQEKLLC